MPDDLPALARPAASPALDRAATERVLARAAELQGARAGAGDGLSEDDVLAAAGEAGLSPEHVRLAIAEERLRAAAGRAPEGGLATWAAGPGHVGAERVVDGTAASALDALGAWLEREECMRLARRVGEQAAWEPRRDVLGNLTRGLRGGGSRGLRRAALVSAVALRRATAACWCASRPTSPARGGSGWRRAPSRPGAAWPRAARSSGSAWWRTR
jgi:hypothetical protein